MYSWNAAITNNCYEEKQKRFEPEPKSKSTTSFPREIMELYKNYQVYQVAGQRVFESSDEVDLKNAEATSNGLITSQCEIFIGQLPRNLYEGDLLLLLHHFGRIQKIRVLMEFSGINRGFAFAVFESHVVARLAVENIHGLLIDGRVICSYLSLDNKRLFVGQVPKCVSEDTIRHMLQSSGIKGVVSVRMVPMLTNSYQHRGHGFITFVDHRHAMAGRKVLYPDKLMVMGLTVSVEWAKPLSSIANKVFVGNISPVMTREMAMGMINSTTKGNGLLDLFYRGNNMICEFTNKYIASKVINLLNGKYVHNVRLEVMWLSQVESSRFNMQYRNEGRPILGSTHQDPEIEENKEKKEKKDEKQAN